MNNGSDSKLKWLNSNPNLLLLGRGLEDFVELVVLVASGRHDRLVVDDAHAVLDVGVVTHSREDADVAAQLLQLNTTTTGANIVLQFDCSVFVPCCRGVCVAAPRVCTVRACGPTRANPVYSSTTVEPD